MVGVRAWLGLLAPLIAVVFSGCLEPTLVEGFHYEFQGGQVWTGYLTWSNGAGGISWDVNGASEDPGGPVDPAQGLKAAAARFLGSNTGDDQGLVPVDEFTSEPLPRFLHLNVSRFIHVTLYAKAAECMEELHGDEEDHSVRLDVELYLNDTFLGGALGGRESWWENPFVDGHCVLKYEIHPELEEVPPGARLRLHVLHRSHVTDLQYGMSGAHRSNITLPHYSDEELRVRFPDTTRKGFCDGGLVFDLNAPYQRFDGGDEGPPQWLGAAPLGLIALVAWPQGRDRRRASLALVLVLGVALSGCANPLASPQLVPTDAPLQGLNGAIEGTICSDFNFPVGNAHVSLLGTNLYADTDVKGAFRFPNVTVGPQVLRIEHDEFLALEQSLVVEAGRSTVGNFTLKSRQDVGPNERPHVHDVWGGNTVLPLWSGDAEFDRFDPTLGMADPKAKGGACVYAGDKLYSPQGALGDAYCLQEFGLSQPEDGLPAIILPGTNEVEVKISWDLDKNKVPRVGLAYSSNSLLEHFNYLPIFMYPKGNGETTHLRTNWDMTDQGHQQFTMWRFLLFIPTDTSGTLPGASLTQLVQSPFHVEMKLHKGVVPLEPSHRDFWGDKTELEVLPPTARNTFCFWELQQTACHLPNPNVGWLPWNKLVPPETRWLEMTMKIENPTPHIPPHDWGLVYKPANKSRSAPVSDYVRATPVDAAQNPRSYRVMVAPEETDQYYQFFSNWVFLVDDLQDLPHVNESDVLLTLTVIAHRIPPPS